MKMSVLVSVRARLLTALCVSVVCGLRLAALPAFPGAEGFGANAVGGRGGSVYVVTNLNDSGAGSFRDAVSQPNRTVVFAVGGVIRIGSRVPVSRNITIAGQTAPGDGITIYGNGVSFSNANDSITRYIRFRQGINGDGGTDAVGIASGDSMIFDHVSASWGRDETFSVSGSPSNITLQDCLVGQGLLIHSAGGLMQTDGGVSVFRTLYADNWMRNPKVKGVHEFTNNVVYNWGSGGGYILGDSAGQSYANISNNYFIAGPQSPASPFTRGNLNFHVFADNNFHDANRNGVLDGAVVPPAGYTTVDFVGQRYPYPAVAKLLSPDEAVAHVLAHAGASLRRDSVDAYMIDELLSLGVVGAHIVNESEVGGVGVVAGGVAPLDTDGDGMPDWWEEAAGTNVAVADNNGDINGDGYTNLENYLNALAPAGVPAVVITGIDNDTGPSATDGITSATALVLRGTSAPGLTITISRADLGVIGTAITDANGQWVFDYSATTLADRYYAFIATADLGGTISPPTKALIVKVDTAAPAAPVISGLATSPEFIFSGTSTPGDSVTIALGGTGGVASTVADGYGRWTAAYSGTPLTPGVYSFTASAVDLAGNAGVASAPYVVNTSLSAPVFTSISDDTGVSATDQITRDTTLVLNGTAPASSTVTITRVGTGVIGVATAAGAGAWSFNYTGTTLASADYVFTATAESGGTASPVSTPFAVKVDTVAPTIDSSARFNPATASTSASTLVFRVTFAEPVINVDVGDFILTNTGTGMTGTISAVNALSSSVYDVTVTGAGGDGTIRLDRRSNSTIQDLAGNAGSSGTYTGGQSYTMRLPGSGVWNNSEAGLWSDVANWENGVIANGSGSTADFSALDIDGDAVAQLDSARTLGRLVFADADQASPGKWILSDNGSATNSLTLASTGSPTIQVNFTGAAGVSNPDIAIAGAEYPAILDVAVNSANGLTKTGWGTAILNRIGTLTGPIAVSQGRLKLGTGAVLTSPSIALAVSTQFEVAGGELTVTGDATMVSGTGVGYVVSAGTANFQRIVPSNARNNLVKVTGGTLNATELNFPRSGDAANMYAYGLVVQGGEANITTVGLGTVNSWGAMSIEGGRLHVDTLNIGYQQTSARGGQARVLDGELVVNELVMSRKNGSNANNVAELNLLGGVTTAERLTLGYDATVNAGSATINFNGGALYLGAGGIVRNGVAPFISTINLTAGTLGAKADWTSDVPMNVGGNVLIRTADIAGAPHAITLTGNLTGAGGFTKVGGGTLTLAGQTTLGGASTVAAGTLNITGTLGGAGTLTLTGGALIGSGVVAQPIVVSGATVAPPDNGTLALTAGDVVWNGGSALAVALGANGQSGRLAVTNALVKGTNGAFPIAFTAGAGFAAGNVYTIATFASTTFAANDFTVTGLPAGFGVVLSLTAHELQATVMAFPEITSAPAAAAQVASPFAYTIAASATPTSYSATGLPAGLSLNPLTGVISGSPLAAGVYPITLGASNAVGSGYATLVVTVAFATGTVNLVELTQAYDGTPKSVLAVTQPAGLAVDITYNGSANAPTLPGTYAVVATIADAGYEGTRQASFEITVTALLRRAPTMNADVDGSVQVLQPESVTLNGSAMISGDLLVPGTPRVQLNGQPLYVGTLDETGASNPTNHVVTLNGGSVLRHVIRRVDAIAMPVVAAPASPAGTRSVSLNNSTQSAGDFATLRNLTLNNGADNRVIPAGNYGSFTVNGSNRLILGTAGATEPSAYSFQSLTLNGSSAIDVVGPVVITLAQGVSLNGSIGSAEHADWVTLRVASGGLTLNGNVNVYGVVVAPNGTVTINGNSTIIGRVSADRLVLNGNGLLRDPHVQP